MVNGLVLLIQVGLLALLVLLALRMVISLVRSEPMAAGHQEFWSGKGQATGHDLSSGTSEWPVAGAAKPGSRDPTGPRPDHYPVAYPYWAPGTGLPGKRPGPYHRARGREGIYRRLAHGAGCALSDKTLRHSETLAVIVAQITSRKTGIRQPEALQTISTLTADKTHLACFRAGLEGAEFWQYNHYVPPTSRLYEAITDNAFI